MAARTVENQTEVPAPAAAVWERVVHPDGINHEMRPWLTMRMPRREHERQLTPVAGGTRVHDRVTFQPRLPVPGLAAVLALVIDAFFRHRQRRLREYFATRVTAP